MSVHVENLKAVFPKTADRVIKNAPIIENELAQSSKYAGNILFPRVAKNSLSVTMENHYKSLMPVEYKNRYEGGKRLYSYESIEYIKASLAHKGGTKVLDSRCIDWLKLDGNMTTNDWARYFDNVDIQQSELINGHFLRNEIENFDMMVRGLLWTNDGQELLIPLTDIDRTQLDNPAVGISFHTNHAWFNNAGVMLPGADVLGDIETIKESIVNRTGKVPIYAHMNRVTWRAIWGNNDLNEHFPGFQNPAYFLHFKQQEDQIMNPLGINFNVYDEYYYLDDREAAFRGVNPRTPQKFIPDYCVLFTPATLGFRAVGPNDWNGQSGVAVNPWLSPDGRTISIDSTESSIPVIGDFNSLHVAWVRDNI